jgi:hypothetical protein
MDMDIKENNEEEEGEGFLRRITRNSHITCKED